MKTKKLFSFVFLLTLLTLSVGCGKTETSDAIKTSDDYKIEGRIILLEKDSMTVVNDVSKEMMEKYSANELLDKRHGRAVIFSSKDASKKFKVGQLVRVWKDKDSLILESDPPQMSASKVEIVED